MSAHPDWPEAAIRDVCQLVGASVNPQDYRSEEFAHFSIPAFDDLRRPAHELGESILSSKTAFPVGAVLFSKLNPRIPRVWHVTKDPGKRCICSTEFLPLLPRPEVLRPDYLALALQNPSLISMLRSRVAAATKSRERLKPSDVLSATIPLPPLQEQERIATKLREQLAEAARMRAAADSSVGLARELEMTEAIRMFLSEDASAWPVDPLGEVLKTCSGLTPSRARVDFFGGDIPWVKTGELTDGTVVETGEHVTETALAETSLRLLPVNTLLVAMYGQGQTRGRTGLLGVPATTNQACFAILPPRDTMDQRFLQYWFRVNYQRIREESEGRGGNQPNLNGVMLRQQKIPHPPIAIQRDVVWRLSHFREASEVVVDATIKVRDSAAQLSSSLLRRIFSEGV